MEVRELAVPGAWSFTPRQWPDSRGVFLEWFKGDVVAGAVGHPMTVRQANHSVSQRGTLRGVHFADVPPSQAKYVYCTRGAVLDVIVDIRVGSPTFGTWDSVELDVASRRAVYLSEGLGHAFLALEDDTNITYLVSAPYAPDREHGIDPLDPALGLPWPAGLELTLSDKDRAAPSLAQAESNGLLPRYADCVSYAGTLGGSGGTSRGGSGQ
ncbi:MAG: dTDP-4-dehydrorhamnose 3,5-epimerase [Actinomycetota bacterium]|nr:dTDP-4-dehydrorhamnose 3,5-epimerase [Actinomycetota bacterium]